jgi:lysophospholipase L1-like esterase
MEGLGKERFRSNLLKTIRLARNLKIGLVFGSPPSAVSAEESPYATFYDALRDEMRKVSDENNVLYIDVHSRFNSIPDKEKLFFPDRVHVNKQGAELEARMVYDFLKERRVLDSL